MVIRHRVRTIRLAGLALAVALAVPGAALAQGKTEESSHWGVAVSYSPSWTASKEFQKLFIIESDELLEGTEFFIGVSRGQLRGGHWTVSYVSKPFKNKTITQVEESSDSFQGSTSYNRTTTTTTFTDVRYKGIEALKYVAFATIKRRVQIGLNAGGGIAWVEGTVDEVFEQYNLFTNAMGQTFENTDLQQETLPANEYVYKYQPLFKVEIQTAVIVAPGLKATVAWGLNGPGIGARVGAVYLFGAK